MNNPIGAEHHAIDIPDDVIDQLKMLLGHDIGMIAPGDLKQAHMNFLANGDILREHDGHNFRDQLHLHWGEENDGNHDHLAHETHDMVAISACDDPDHHRKILNAGGSLWDCYKQPTDLHPYIHHEHDYEHDYELSESALGNLSWGEEQDFVSQVTTPHWMGEDLFTNLVGA